jgi:peptidoglycan glycosyltransferase
MNRQISRLYLIFTLLFTVLIGFTAWWSVIKADDLKDNTANKRPILEQQKVPRGLILARDKSRLAANKSIGRKQNKRYYRIYPHGGLFSHAVGYSFVSRGDAGLEKSQNDFLSGNVNEFESLVDALAGGPKEGDDVQTALDPKAQRVALSALGGQRGSIVAIEPATGAVRVMASKPDFNPNEVPQRYKQLNSEAAGSPLFNRATQASYPPGSTFKVVTAAAALDSGKYSPSSLISGKNDKPISGVPLANFGGENFGAVSLTDALTHSVNTVFGEIGEKLGKRTMYRYMRRFGFDSKPPLDYPKDQMNVSGVYGKGGKILDENNSVDIGRVAIGQERLQVTPLQMAMVASAVANKGRLMQPHFTEKVTAPDGRVREDVQPIEQSRVMSEKSASELTDMMKNVVESGTGVPGQLQGIQVAGKTGTAEAPGGFNDAWFIAFAPADKPKIAIAVVVEHTQQSQTGGEVAAPLAARVMQTLVGGGG